MKKKLTVQEYVVVASMLFGLFFGAGNLIFPVHMGQMAGSQLVPATLGFLITGVGLPLLSVAALGISKSEGLFDLSRKVSRPYAYFFTCLLYLTIGPFFAIPRCATTAFTVGIEQAVPQAAERLRLWLLVFSAVFFAAALLFSLFPGKILTWVGKILNPFFLLFLGILIIVALVKPSAAISAVAPEGAYASQAFSTGFLEGYNTMDVLGRSCLRHHRGAGHPGAGRYGRGRSRIEYGQGGRVQQSSDGAHLSCCNRRRRAVERAFCDE